MVSTVFIFDIISLSGFQRKILTIWQLRSPHCASVTKNSNQNIVVSKLLYEKNCVMLTHESHVFEQWVVTKFEV